ncbi:hypothetical protein D3C76_962660 [compost metagenome]
MGHLVAFAEQQQAAAFGLQVRQHVEAISALDHQPLLAQELFGCQVRRVARFGGGAVLDDGLVGLQVLVKVGRQ